MLIAVKNTSNGATVLVNLDHIVKIVPMTDGGTLVCLDSEDENIHCTTTMEAWGEMPFVQKMFRGRL